MAKISKKRKKNLAKEAQENQGGVRYFDMKKLKSAVLRQLPLSDEEIEIAPKIGLHFRGAGQRALVCPNVTHGNECPVCSTRWRILDQIDDLVGDVDDDDLPKKLKEEVAELREITDALKVTVRHAMKVIDRENPEEVLLAELPVSVYKEIFTAYEEDEEDLSHPEEGRDFRIKKSGSGRYNTEYSTRILEPSPLHDDADTAKKLTDQAQSIEISSLYKVDEDSLEEYVTTTVPHDLLDEDSPKRSSSSEDEDPEDTDENEDLEDEEFIDEDEEDPEDEDPEDELEDEDPEDEEDPEDDLEDADPEDDPEEDELEDEEDPEDEDDLEDEEDPEDAIEDDEIEEEPEDEPEPPKKKAAPKKAVKKSAPKKTTSKKASKSVKSKISKASKGGTKKSKKRRIKR